MFIFNNNVLKMSINTLIYILICKATIMKLLQSSFLTLVKKHWCFFIDYM